MSPLLKHQDSEVDSTVTTVKAYEAVSEYLGFGFIEAGKTMGLAPYGKADKNIPDLFYKETGKGDKNVLVPQYPAGAFIDTNRTPYLKINSDISEIGIVIHQKLQMLQKILLGKFNKKLKKESVI